MKPLLQGPQFHREHSWIAPRINTNSGFKVGLFFKVRELYSILLAGAPQTLKGAALKKEIFWTGKGDYTTSKVSDMYTLVDG